jgi:polyferredoxin/formate hydrogenlyase subunit 6/NADH:ubiquinone oxidoreductase subunit I
MKLRTARRIAQVFFFSLFLFLVFVADLRYLKGYPISLFLELDPLAAFATAITTHTIYMGLLWSLTLVLLTVLFGRVFCNWICPYGILHHVTGWLFGKRRAAVRERIEANRYKKFQSLKYVILIAMIVAAICGSLQTGLLDPLCLFHRSMTVAVLPMLNLFVPSSVYVHQYFHSGAWIIGFLLLFLVVMNVFVPRFFCRVLCPLGAFLGTLSAAALWRIDRDPDKCVDCDLCLKNCEGAADPQARLRKSECFVCFNCIEDCPKDALSFRFMPALRREITAPVVPARRAFLGTLIGLTFYAFGRASGASDRNYDKRVIRPPGSVEEKDFLERCIKCDQCLRVCPTNVLQPALMESGLEGVWTPLLNMKLGFCEVNCTLCGQVCPTGAIQRISIEEKTGTGPFAAQGPIRLGTAFFDRGRCLPWAMATPCVVCEEVCPVSPKAIYSREVTVTRRDGTSITLRQPHLDPAQCIGCGSCEHECPVNDEAAVRVTAVGETRSRDRRLLMDGGVTGAARSLENQER